MVLWATPFRPFFLGASTFAALAMAAWVLLLTGVLVLPIDVRWHAHELLYGFFSAVLTGFILTAAKNWVSQPPVSGTRLGALFAVWLAGRVAAFIPHGSPLAPLRFVSVALPVMVLVFLWGYLKQKGQEGNRVFLAALALFTVGDAVSLLDAPVAFAPFLERGNGLWLGLHVAQWLIVLMSAKTMPLFVERAAGVPIRTWPLVERASSLGIVAAMAADFFDAPGWLLAIACFVAAAANAVRLAGFHPVRGIRTKLLFLVVIGYGFLVAGYLGLGVVSLLGTSVVLVLHLFTAGAVSCMVFAIMSRIALGHTGRPIAVSPVLLAGYVLVAAAGVLRAAAGAWQSERSYLLVWSGGIAFALSWALYAAWSARFLLRPRVDGKPG